MLRNFSSGIYIHACPIEAPIALQVSLMARFRISSGIKLVVTAFPMSYSNPKWRRSIVVCSNRRAFSIARAAWSPNNWSKRISLSLKASVSWLVTLITPVTHPPVFIGMLTIEPCHPFWFAISSKSG